MRITYLGSIFAISLLSSGVFADVNYFACDQTDFITLKTLTLTTDRNDYGAPFESSIAGATSRLSSFLNYSTTHRLFKSGPLAKNDTNGNPVSSSLSFVAHPGFVNSVEIDAKGYGIAVHSSNIGISPSKVRLPDPSQNNRCDYQSVNFPFFYTVISGKGAYNSHAECDDARRKLVGRPQADRNAVLFYSACTMSENPSERDGYGIVTLTARWKRR